MPQRGEMSLVIAYVRQFGQLLGRQDECTNQPDSLYQRKEAHKKNNAANLLKLIYQLHIPIEME